MSHNTDMRELTADEMVTVTGGNPVLAGVILLDLFLAGGIVGMIGDNTTTNVTNMMKAILNKG